MFSRFSPSARRSRSSAPANTVQVELIAGRAGAGLLGPHGEHLFDQRQLVPGVLEAAGRLGLAQEGEGLADLAQFLGPALHAPGDPFHGAEEVGQERHVVGAAVGTHRPEALHVGEPFVDIFPPHVDHPAVVHGAGVELGELAAREEAHVATVRVHHVEVTIKLPHYHHVSKVTVPIL